MMKRITVLLLTISIILCLASGSLRAQQSPANSLRVPTEKNTLIVYLSRTNNTKAIAEISTRGGSEIDGHNLVIKDAKAEEARKEVESWLRTLGILR